MSDDDPYLAALTDRHMRNRRPPMSIAWGVLIVTATACSPRLRAGDDAKLERLAAALDGVDPADPAPSPRFEPLRLAELTLAGLAELDLGRSSRCRRSLDRLERSDANYELRERSSVAVADCGFTCGIDLDSSSFLHASNATRTQMVLRACPPSPTFAGADATSLAGANATVYLALHEMWSQTAAATRSGTPTARAAWERIERHRASILLAVGATDARSTLGARP